MNHNYTRSAQVMHWGMALLILALLIAGLAMVQSLAPWQPVLVSMHKAFGILAMFAVLIRLVIRLQNPPPVLPASVPTWQQRVSAISHLLFYAGMIAMPLSGWLMQSAAGRPVAFFGLFTLPDVLPNSLVLYSFFRESHGLIALALIALIHIHIAAALYHAWVKRDGVFSRMIKSNKTGLS